MRNTLASPKPTEQEEKWLGDMGKRYTDRSTYKPEELDALYLKSWGVTCSEMNGYFLRDLPRDIKILEVGAGSGNQLEMLHQMGFKNLYGLELQPYAIDKGRTLGFESSRNIIVGSALDIPFKDDFFDLVYTSGTLIHIAPENLHRAMSEIIRCSNRWIWGFEYWAEKTADTCWHGEPGLLWRAPYPELFLEQDLILMKIQQYHENRDKNLIDVMYLLEK